MAIDGPQALLRATVYVPLSISGSGSCRPPYECQHERSFRTALADDPPRKGRPDPVMPRSKILGLAPNIAAQLGKVGVHKVFGLSGSRVYSCQGPRVPLVLLLMVPWGL